MKDSIRGILPGIFTMGNLACGFAAIVIGGGAQNIFGPEKIRIINEAVWLIILAAFFDFLDGLVARFSKSASRFGVELDSLADIVSFGIAPAVLIINFSLITKGNWSWILAFAYIMAASFRLARFNMTASIEGKSNFLGLPVPSAAVTILSFILFATEVWGNIRFERYFIILILTTSVLMVTTIEFESMPKFDFSRPRNRFKVLFLLIAGVGLMINASLVMFPLALLYIGYGLIKMMVMMFFVVSKGPREKSAISESRKKKIENKE